MLYFSKWKTILILGLVALGFLFAMPNAVPKDKLETWPNSLQRTINLGLDLQGGAHMLLEVDLSSVLEQQNENLRDTVRDKLREAGRIRTEYLRVEDGAVVGKFRNPEEVEAGYAALATVPEQVDPSQLAGPKDSRVERVGADRFRVTITEDKIDAVKERTIEQSIEVLGRRIDPNGTTELTLVKEGSDRILLQVPGAKNVDEIKERINKTANLSFHLVDSDSFNEGAMRLAAEGRVKPSQAFYPMSDGGALIVERRTKITGECLKEASEGLHPERQNDPIVNFGFNLNCSKLFSELTSRNMGKQFAVVLDGEIITAPRINSPITGGSGFIEGGFTLKGAQELALLLNAGSLPAKLQIVEERTVSAELGEDSINAGKIASIIGLVGVAIFMWLSYGLRFGTIANMALTINIILIMAALSLFGATLTLPGIAGIILTIGMAVDANVLIFERIREEAHNGRPPVNAIETGYRLSLAPILDANITTFIAAAVLYLVGSGPIRGFAVTLAIGIVMSVFTAVIVARLFTATWLRSRRPKVLPI